MSSPRVEDRRVRKTRKALREALAELLVEKSIQNITVRELADKADVHRSTFYVNFKDVYDLYSQMEDAVIQEISSILSVEYNFDTKTFFGVLFRYLADNKKICRLFLGESVNGTFYNRVSDLFEESCVDCWREEYKLTVTTEVLRPYAHFFLSGSLGVVGQWAAGSFERPAEEVVTMLAEIEDTFRLFIKTKFA
ncbi:MAG: TetR/AcrR family transcriptional regulator [Oscillospiraceae bacterium]|nr:TetR/AcrR family transcriptional regulator [Oscillospiraceae bacterium]